MKTAIAKLAALLRRFLEIVLVACVGILTVSVLFQVFIRELFSFSYLPLEDVIPYAFSVSTFAGAALLFDEKAHIAITVLTDVMPNAIRRAAVAISEAGIFLFLLFMLYYGYEFWLDGRFQYSPLLAIKLFYIYTIVPLAAFSGLVFMLNNFLNPKPEEPNPEAEPQPGSI